MTRKGPGPVRLDRVLGQVLDRHGLQDQVHRMSVLELWPDIVGAGIGRVTRARGVEDATLFVEVRTSAWLMELNMMKGELLAKVNERLSEAPLERIVFVLAGTG